MHAFAYLDPARAERLADAQPTLMSYELVRSLAWEQQEHAHELSADLLELLELGRGVTAPAPHASSACGPCSAFPR